MRKKSTNWTLFLTFKKGEWQKFLIKFWANITVNAHTIFKFPRFAKNQIMLRLMGRENVVPHQQEP